MTNFPVFRENLKELFRNNQLSRVISIGNTELQEITSQIAVHGKVTRTVYP